VLLTRAVLDPPAFFGARVCRAPRQDSVRQRQALCQGGASTGADDATATSALKVPIVAVAAMAGLPGMINHEM